MFPVQFWSALYEELWLAPSTSRLLDDASARASEHLSDRPAAAPTLNASASATASVNGTHTGNGIGNVNVKIIAQSVYSDCTAAKQNGCSYGSMTTTTTTPAAVPANNTLTNIYANNNCLTSPATKPLSRVDSPAIPILAAGSASPMNRTQSLVRLPEQPADARPVLRALLVRPLSPTSPTAQADRYSSTSSLSHSFSESNLFEVVTHVTLTSCSPQTTLASPIKEQLLAGDSIAEEDAIGGSRRQARDARSSLVCAAVSATNTPEKPFARHAVISAARPISAHRLNSPHGAPSRGSTDSPARFYLPDSDSPEPTVYFGPPLNGSKQCATPNGVGVRTSNSSASIDSLGRDTPNTSITNLAAIDAGDRSAGCGPATKAASTSTWCDVSNTVAALLEASRGAYSTPYVSCFVEEDGLQFAHAVECLVRIKQAAEFERLRNRNLQLERSNKSLRSSQLKFRSSLRHSRALDSQQQLLQHAGDPVNGGASSALMTGERCTSLEELEELQQQNSERILQNGDYPLMPIPMTNLTPSPSGPHSLTGDWQLLDSLPIVNKWMPNDLAKDCARCGVAFSMLRRKHHCRLCGLVVCDTCSQHAVPLPEQQLSPRPVRVCHWCYRKIGMENGVVTARPVARRKTISMGMEPSGSSAENVSHLVNGGGHLIAPLTHAHSASASASASGPMPYNGFANSASFARLASFSPTLDARRRNSSLLGDAQAPDVRALVANASSLASASFSTSSIPLSCRLQSHMSVFSPLISAESSLVASSHGGSDAAERAVSALLVNGGGVHVHPVESHSVEVMVCSSDDANGCTYRSSNGASRSGNGF